jgi:hypothetical protein
MKTFSAKSTRVNQTVLLAVAILLLLPASISAQQRERPSGTARPSPTGGRVPEQPRLPSVRERQFKVVEMEREAARARTPEEEKLALTQIAEDFEKLQVINNRMMGATMRAVAPDYARVAETTAEIKKRAHRIKDNLRLPKVAAAKDEKGFSYKKAQDTEVMKANLLALDGSIMSFIKNPIFTNPGVVNVEQAEKASRGLETIIELSNLISKDAEKLSKPSAKNP